MSRREHLTARSMTVAGLLVTAAYLVWRSGWSWRGAPLWLWLPALAVEAVGFAGAAVLTWALWPQRVAGRTRAATDDVVLLPAVPAVVRVHDQAAHEVRATVLALRAVHGVGRTVLLDVAGRPEVAALATELGVDTARRDSSDPHGVRALAAAAGSAVFLLLDAGDVPAVDLVDRLSPELADPMVAVVQGEGTSYAEDSPEHGPNHRHELLFERAGLNPALGARGVAVWTGSGSLVRADAVADVVVGIPGAGALDTEWAATHALHAAGWRIVAPAGTVFAQRSLSTEAAVHVDRIDRARAARHLLLAPEGALRPGPLPLKSRLALLAWAVRPLSGLRRAVFVGVVCAALVAGAVPFTAPAAVLFGLWLPGFVLVPAGLVLLSGRTLRPGDRTRWSLHTLGAAWAGLRASSERIHPPVLSSGRTPYTAGLTGAVVALSVVLALRGISDRLTHTLGELPQAHLLALLTTALWMLAMSLDLLRVLARRAQLRRSPRVVAALSAVLGDRGVTVVDLTPLGAGAVSHIGLEVGERLVLDTSIPTRTGITGVRIPCVVRNVVPRNGGEWRIGLEFGEADPATAAALAEYCVLEPMWERMGATPGPVLAGTREIIYLPEPDDTAAGRLVVRVASLLAIAGAVGSTLPGTAEAAAARVTEWRGTVVVAEAGVATDDGVPVDTVVADSLVDRDEPVPATDAPVVASDATDPPEGVPGAVVWAVCSLDAGADGEWGTADDTYAAPVSTITAADGSYELLLDGAVCWASVAPPEGFVPVETATDLPPQPLALDGSPTRTDVRAVESPAPADQPGAAGATVGDLVWRDLDGDGMQDAAEPGVAGVRVALLGADGSVRARTASDGSGRFRFTGLPAGDYTLLVTGLPDGTAFAPSAAGADAAADSDVDVVTGRSATIRVPEGGVVDGVDVGLVDRALDAAPTADADGSSAAPAVPAARVLPEPPHAATLRALDPVGSLTVVVLLLAGLLALSILLGLARPRGLTAVQPR